jgi:hypothetical protein
MSLSDEFLETSRYLLRRNNNRPTQGDLRRAISTAYYAIFHRLIEDATTSCASAPGTADLVARVYSHSDMKNACRSVLKSPIPKPFDAFFPSGLPLAVRATAKLFVVLQEVRHEADYNRGRTFTKSETRDLIAQIGPTLHDWDGVKSTTEGSGLLVLLLLGERIERSNRAGVSP